MRVNADDVVILDDRGLLTESRGANVFLVVEVDGRQVGRGSLGSITQRIRERYWQRHFGGPDVTPVLA